MMFTTEIRAIGQDGELHTFVGPNVEGVSIATTQEYCEENGLGYCRVTGQLISEIPTLKNSLKPDWDKRVDYDHQNN